MKPLAALDSTRIKALREQTGAGMMECKQALEQAGGRMEEALKLLKVRGAEIAAKKADRQTREGVVSAYVHGHRIGVLLEVNCETDFVARNERFRELVHHLELQIAAMDPKYIRPEDVPPEIVEEELAQLHGQLEGASGDAFVSAQKSHMEKFYARLCLLNQPFVKDESKTIRDLLTETIAATGENIVIQRFARYQLGQEA